MRIFCKYELKRVQIKCQNEQKKLRKAGEFVNIRCKTELDLKDFIRKLSNELVAKNKKATGSFSAAHDKLKNAMLQTMSWSQSDKTKSSNSEVIINGSSGKLVRNPYRNFRQRNYGHYKCPTCYRTPFRFNSSSRAKGNFQPRYRGPGFG